MQGQVARVRHRVEHHRRRMVGEAGTGLRQNSHRAMTLPMDAAREARQRLPLRASECATFVPGGAVVNAERNLPKSSWDQPPQPHRAADQPQGEVECEAQVEQDAHAPSPAGLAIST